MRKAISLTIIFIMVFIPLILASVLAAQKTDLPVSEWCVGKWIIVEDKKDKDGNPQVRSKVRIYKEEDGTFTGHIVWIKDYNPKDPPMAKDGNPTLGYKLLWGFKYNEKKDIWEDGKITDPEEGKTYYCGMKIEKDKKGNPNGKLKVRGSLDKGGVFGRTQFWEWDKNQDLEEYEKNK